MPDVGNAPRGGCAPRRRPVGKRARRPDGPLRLRRAGPPADHVEDALGRCAVRVEEVCAVAMIRYRPLVLAGPRGVAGPAGHAGSREPSDGSDGAAAGEFHVAPLWPNAGNYGAEQTLTCPAPLPRFRALSIEPT